MYDFAIMSLPRSGSHMLMSALHSHPEITMIGELGMKEKFPLAPSVGSLRGCIVPTYRLPNPTGISQKTAMIFLLRDIQEIDCSPYHQLLAPIDDFDALPPISRLPYLVKQLLLMDNFMVKHRAKEYVVTYNELCGGRDVRELNLSAELCRFLGVSEQPLQPLTYKPTLISDDHRTQCYAKQYQH